MYSICIICGDSISEPTARRCFGRDNPEPDFYCGGCIKTYLNVKIQEANLTSIGSIDCPCGPLCSNPFSERDIRLIFSDDDDAATMKKYDRFKENMAVEKNGNMRWCPNQQCSEAVAITLSTKIATCKACSTRFCVKCSTDHGAWTSCSQDTNFKNWRETTKQGCTRCPGCRTYIEKNEGCKHMTCSRCKYQFCWDCKSQWKGSCSNPRYCKIAPIVRSKLWGDTAPVRAVTKTAGAVAVVGVVGVALGLGAAALGVAVTGAAIVGVTVPPVMLAAKIRKAVKKRRDNKEILKTTELAKHEHVVRMFSVHKHVSVIRPGGAESAVIINTNIPPKQHASMFVRSRDVTFDVQYHTGEVQTNVALASIRLRRAPRAQPRQLSARRLNTFNNEEAGSMERVMDLEKLEPNHPVKCNSIGVDLNNIIVLDLGEEKMI